MTNKVLVTGAGGFIGSHLVRYLKAKGYCVRGVDVKLPEYAPTVADEFELLDLREYHNALIATRGVQHVYALAADMGGIGYMVNGVKDAVLRRNNALINLHTIEAARVNGVSRYLYTSSACVYNEHKQTVTEVTPLKESDAYPAQPDLAYGWEKLFTEQLCTEYTKDYGMQTRIVRFHNVYGEFGTWNGGKEKAPAALCRKIAVAKLAGKKSIDVWGDGEQTRSFCYIDDCVEGVYRIMQSDYAQPLNLGRDDLVSINELARVIMKIAGVHLTIEHVPGAIGVRGRNSDNSQLQAVTGWQPSIDLETGLAKTYAWIESQVKEWLKIPSLPSKVA